jgi:glycosyltransferase involved in cell wall biosynthesis
MHFGVPCVTTSTGVQGLDEARMWLPVGDEADQLAEHVLRMLEDDEAWLACSEAGRAFVSANYTTQAQWQSFAAELGGEGA